MFKEYGFKTNKPTYNKLWVVCSKLYPTACDVMLSDLAMFYFTTGTFPESNKTLKKLLQENEELAVNYSSRFTFIKSLGEEVEYLAAEEIFKP